MKKTDQELLDCYFQGRASDEEVAELEQRMLAAADLRQRYLHEAMCEADLRCLALRDKELIPMPQADRKRRPALALVAGASAQVPLMGRSDGDGEYLNGCSALNPTRRPRSTVVLV